MTATGIPALLEPIQERLDAITPGKWFREYSDVITSDPDPRDVEEGYDDPRSMRIVRAAPHLNKREPQGIKNADFIANAPTDTARLLAAVKAVTEMHRPVKIYDECECPEGTHPEDYDYFDCEDYNGCHNSISGIGCEECCVDGDYLSQACGESHAHTMNESERCPTVSAVESALRSEA